MKEDTLSEALRELLAFVNKHADDMVINGSVHPDELNSACDRATEALAAMIAAAPTPAAAEYDRELIAEMLDEPRRFSDSAKATQAALIRAAESGEARTVCRPASVGQGEAVAIKGYPLWKAIHTASKKSGHTCDVGLAQVIEALNSFAVAHPAAVREGEYPSDEEMDAIEDARDEAEMFPPAAVREATAEYIAARDAYEEATRPLASHGPIRTLKHGDPIVLRYRAARAALSRDGVEGGAVVVETVGFAKETGTGDRYIDWTIEGGIHGLPLGAELLFSATKLTDDEGSGEVYTHLAAVRVSDDAEIEAALNTPLGLDHKLRDAIHGARGYARTDVVRALLAALSRDGVTPAGQGEAVGWVFQHEETGRMAFCENDGINTPEVFARLNPRRALVTAAYTHPGAVREVDDAMVEALRADAVALERHWDEQIAGEIDDPDAIVERMFKLWNALRDGVEGGA